MNGQIMLSSATSEAIQAVADDYLARTRALLAPSNPPDAVGEMSLAASVAVQGAVRALLQDQEGPRASAILTGGSEGLGMILGLIEDPLERVTLFQHCVAAMVAGLNSQAEIHTPAGQA